MLNWLEITSAITLLLCAAALTFIIEWVISWHYARSFRKKKRKLNKEEKSGQDDG